MSKITLTLILHHGIDQIKIDFAYNTDIKNYIKKFDAVKWSQTHNAFCMPFSRKGTNRLYVYLRKRNYYVNYCKLPLDRTA